ncbi:Kef-type K+ transport system, membrane component [Candidatus Nitrososphaera evergladensis SR1]|jgi:Kef-type K+ transport system membrane component KefB|uniref:Kef-type K+ transport system, membrane component n=1 Tax=Candidatus Nitrososphaera evergladensis SR1 TaxID=1459636 RepID=A0A075MXK6_9ARCH|nr:cation:proton antiporter [Candidatus Nitrososphaera evergladensis]AIF84034.1 Kef-type K+ transport system, membrane component [Candidatus Nitrososphaera evergladensis SR1]
MAAEELFVSVIIILVAARVLGELFQRIKQPPLIGEILAGVLIGPSVLGIVQHGPSLDVLSDLAVFFLMLLAGLEMDPKEIRRVGKYAIVISLIAFFVPFASGTLVAQAFGLALSQSLFMGLLLSITAVPVSAIVLMQFGILRSKLGNIVITAAVINDILSLVVLSIVLQIGAEGSAGQVVMDVGAIAWSGAKIAAFLAGIFLFDLLLRSTSHWLPARVEPYFKKLQTKEAAFGILLITTIAVSLIAQDIGLHFVIGTFFSGLIIYKEIIGKQNFDRVYNIISAITFGFFAPIFFAIIGIDMDLKSLVNAIPLFLALLAVAVAAKIGGSYLGARLVRFSKDTSIAIGFLMNGRGMVELVIASIGFAAGIIDITLFSVAVAIGFATTIMAPITAKPFVARAKERDKTSVEAQSDGDGSGGQATYGI